jgi:hypothetical protein
MWRYAKGAAVAVGILVFLVATGVAWATWRADGAGHARGAADRAVALTTEATTATGTLLVPGGEGDLVVRVRNPNRYPVQITSIAAIGAVQPDAEHAAGCSPTGVTFVPPVDLALELAAGQTREFTVADAVHMAGSAAQGCQGAVFTIPVRLTGASNA